MTGQAPLSPLRLEFVPEDDFVNAYLRIDSSEKHGSTLISSMRMAIVEKHPRLMDVWKIVLQDALAGIIGKKLGVEVSFQDQPSDGQQNSG